MRSINLVLVSIIIISFLVSGCSDDSNPVADIPEPGIEGNTYSNPELNFQISAPDGWILTKDVEAGGYHILLLGQLSGNAGAQSTFNIVSEYNGSDIGMADFLPLAKETIKSMFGEVEYYSERVITEGDFECGELVYRLIQDEAPFIHKQLYFCSNNSIVVVTFNCLSSFYVQVKNDFDYITNSLKTIR